uniref:Transmembrane protein n=1 Tax=Arabidopsis thaliana TaxID=3702 RepID=Q8LC92_ARATH|nr:unknown [Arabidopsis thaliana]
MFIQRAFQSRCGSGCVCDVGLQSSRINPLNVMFVPINSYSKNKESGFYGWRERGFVCITGVLAGFCICCCYCCCFCRLKLNHGRFRSVVDL